MSEGYEGDGSWEDAVVRLLEGVIAELKALRADLGARPQTQRQGTGATQPASGGVAGGGAPSGGNAGNSRGVVKFGRDAGKRFEEVADLTWYRDAILRSVDDPTKAQYRQWNLDDVAAIDRVIADRSGSSPANDAPPADEFGPPPTDDNWPF